MNGLEILVTEYLASLAPSYFIRQCLVILALFILGAVLSDLLLARDVSRRMRYVLAYPSGIAAFVITTYAMLVAGIPYNTLSVSIAMLVETAAAVILNIRSDRKRQLTLYVKPMLAALAAATICAIISCSAAAPVSITNDTMYYFKRYPDCIVYFGGLRDQFDSWLTDTGLGIVTVDTLPALFGFGESFGIREMFHINFVAFFSCICYERAGKYITGKNRIIAAALTAAVLVTATPFVILGHWALANMYFMEMFFIAAYTAVDFNDSIGTKSLLLLALSLFRIEGTLFVVWLVLCICIYADIGKKLALSVMLPMAVLFGSYCLKIFTQYYLFDDIYLFLTPKKAVLLVGAIVATAVYLMFIQPVLPEKLTKYLPCIYIAGALALNAAFLVRDSELYLGNLATFGRNLFGQSGWGMMPYFVITMGILLIMEYALAAKRGKIGAGRSNGFNITLTVGFLLITIAASYGRGDALSGYVGDSGNRVLLQIVPLVVLMYSELTMNLLGFWGESS